MLRFVLLTCTQTISHLPVSFTAAVSLVFPSCTVRLSAVGLCFGSFSPPPPSLAACRRRGGARGGGARGGAQVVPIRRVLLLAAEYLGFLSSSCANQQTARPSFPQTSLDLRVEPAQSRQRASPRPPHYQTDIKQVENGRQRRYPWHSPAERNALIHQVCHQHVSRRQTVIFVCRRLSISQT